MYVFVLMQFTNMIKPINKTCLLSTHLHLFVCVCVCVCIRVNSDLQIRSNPVMIFAKLITKWVECCYTPLRPIICCAISPYLNVISNYSSCLYFETMAFVIAEIQINITLLPLTCFVKNKWIICVSSIDYNCKKYMPMSYNQESTDLGPAN